MGPGKILFKLQWIFLKVNSVLFQNCWTEITEFSIAILLMESEPSIYSLQILKKKIIEFVVSSIIVYFAETAQEKKSQKKNSIYSFGDSLFWNWLFASCLSACIQSFLKKKLLHKNQD